MMSTEASSPAEHEIERLLRSLEGIASARVATDTRGRIESIHILAFPAFHPKQVVRNVESGLSAGLGLIVDRRVISVAQLTDGQAPDTQRAPAGNGQAGSRAPTPADAGNGTRHPAEPRGRFVFVSYDASSQQNHEVLCRVTVRRDRETFTGTAAASYTPLGRAQAATRALFDALENASDDDAFVLDDVALVSSLGRSFVLVAAHVRHGRTPLPLTGVAALVRAPEEAAILAALQAVNRWTGIDD